MMDIFEGFEKLVAPQIKMPEPEPEPDLLDIERQVEPQIEDNKPAEIDYDKLAEAMLRIQNSKSNEALEDTKPKE